MHPGANITHLCCTKDKMGLNLQLPSNIFDKCQTNVRNILHQSEDANVKSIYDATKHKYVENHTIISTSVETERSCKSIQNKSIQDSCWANFVTLKKQSIIITYLTENLGVNRIKSWQKVIHRLPNNIFSFCRRYLILALPTKANLKTWNIINDNTCILCNKKPETQHHIISNCPTAAEDRYKWRHDSVLYTIAHYLLNYTDNSYKLFVDIEGYENPAILFHSCRPDILLLKNDTLYVIELTVCFETNFIKSHEYKINRYRNLKDNLIDKKYKLVIYAVEFSAIGLTSSNLINFTRFLKTLKIDVHKMISKCSEVCVRSSYYIFNRRGKDWTFPALMKFF